MFILVHTHARTDIDIHTRKYIHTCIHTSLIQLLYFSFLVCIAFHLSFLLFITLHLFSFPNLFFLPHCIHFHISFSFSFLLPFSTLYILNLYFFLDILRFSFGFPFPSFHNALSFNSFFFFPSFIFPHFLSDFSMFTFFISYFKNGFLFISLNALSFFILTFILFSDFYSFHLIFSKL